MLKQFNVILLVDMARSFALYRPRRSGTKILHSKVCSRFPQNRA